MSPLIESALSIWPLSKVAGLASAFIAYPIAEKLENRQVRQKVKELRGFYTLPATQRALIEKERLANVIEFAAHQVPYYRDLFSQLNINPQKIKKDIAYLSDIPYLTKEIIREQSGRMLSKPLDQIRHHVCKTGGSTGLSSVIYYDQPAADYSAAVTLYARERIGKVKSRSELHFACRFPDSPVVTEWFTREDFKCFAMNRTNIFFDRLDEIGLEEVIALLKRRKPYLVHAHPSTMYALACYLHSRGCSLKLFSIFESSGELLENHQRALISKVLRCEVIDRYGLAELGVMAYQLSGSEGKLQVLESEGWAESATIGEGSERVEELIFTGFHNHLMPLIRYRTGDLGTVERNEEGVFLKNVVGRIHDQVPINGINHPTHHIQDMLDHRVGGIQEFQIDLRTSPPKLKVVPESSDVRDHISQKINQFWGDAFELEFIGHEDLIRVGRHAKFRHVVTA
ncbi:phenylacetate--CoA ligase family protein [Polynucleobacter sp. UK-Mo-2m-Kol15]|nr:phenylacetate--CoA ligase family protein [Polynucleobacter sp. UK-Mo-2m-Kol15]